MSGTVGAEARSLKKREAQTMNRYDLEVSVNFVVASHVADTNSMGRYLVMR